MLFGLSIDLFDAIGLFLLLSGFVIGLGAVTVIDLHGFLGRSSAYWTEATTRTHKVTKPMIWIGLLLTLIGGCIFYRAETTSLIPLVHLASAVVLMVNGCFLTFGVSRFLLARERAGKQKELLPDFWQRRIVISFLLSDTLWWGNLALLVVYLVGAR